MASLFPKRVKLMDLSVNQLADIYKSAAEELLEGMSEEEVHEYTKEADTSVDPEIRKNIMNAINSIIHDQSDGKVQEAAQGLVKLRDFITGDPTKGTAGHVNPEAIHPIFLDEFINEELIWEDIELVAKGEEPLGYKENLDFFILEHLLEFVAQDGVFTEPSEEVAAANP